MGTSIKVGRCSIEDEPQTGRPHSSTTLDIIAEVQELVSIDPHLSIEEIALTLDISSGSVHTIYTIFSNSERFQRCGKQKSSQKGEIEKRVSCAKELIK